MPELIHILALPFLACILMGIILSYLGIHVLKREVIFIDIAVAQVAAVGSIIAHLAFDVEDDSLISFSLSLAFVLFIAAFYSAVRRSIKQISIEAIIGISYAITAATALFLIGLAPGHFHAQEMLAGNLLWVTWPQIIKTLIVFFIVGFCLYIFREPLAKISDQYQNTLAQGLKAACWDFYFYALLGVVITLAVHISGVVVVFAFLIMPATISSLLCSRWGARMLIGWVATIIASITGLLFSYYFDFSVGPAIALMLGCLLVITALLFKS